VAEKSHEVIKLTEAVIAEIHKENRLLSNHTRETNDLHRELESERSIKQRLERENRELQTSSESGQKVLDELRGLKAVVERQADDLGLKISDVKNTDVKNSENQEETAGQLLESNAELKRQLDETEIALQKCLQSLDVADQLTEMLEFVDGLDLNTLKFQEVAIKLAKVSSSNDSSFSDMIDGQNFFELPFVICEQMISKLKELLPPNQRMADDFGNTNAGDVIYKVYSGLVAEKDLPPKTTRHFVHLIHKIRNQFAHPEKDDFPETKQIRVCLVLFAASILWTDLPPDQPALRVRVAA
tara:strand:- start:349 stop:1245 length:897 start_codon:yes stop_codon:yes gene_type:complete